MGALMTFPASYFYPRSPCGERPRACPALSPRPYFYPRSPCGERRKRPMMPTTPPAFLSTLSLRRATVNSRKGVETMVISIHALLAESDHYDNYNLHCVEISIHALLAESDSMLISLFCGCSDFYPRSPCGERQADSVSKWTAT